MWRPISAASAIAGAHWPPALFQYPADTRKGRSFHQPALDRKPRYNSKSSLGAPRGQLIARSQPSHVNSAAGKAVQAVPIEAPLESPSARTGRPPPVDTGYTEGHRQHQLTLKDARVQITCMDRRRLNHEAPRTSGRGPPAAGDSAIAATLSVKRSGLRPDLCCAFDPDALGRLQPP